MRGEGRALLGSDRSHGRAGTSLRPGQRLAFARPLHEARRGRLGESEGGGVAQILASEADVGEAAVVEFRQHGEFAAGLRHPRGPGNEPPKTGKSRAESRHESLLTEMMRRGRALR